MFLFLLNKLNLFRFYNEKNNNNNNQIQINLKNGSDGQIQKAQGPHVKLHVFCANVSRGTSQETSQ